MPLRSRSGLVISLRVLTLIADYPRVAKREEEDASYCADAGRSYSYYTFPWAGGILHGSGTSCPQICEGGMRVVYTGRNEGGSWQFLDDDAVVPLGG